MKIEKTLWRGALIAGLMLLTHTVSARKQPADYVNAFIGTTNFGTPIPVQCAPMA